MRSQSILFLRKVTPAVVLAACFGTTIFGQGGFVAIPPLQSSQYHIDFARNFFADAQAEKADRANLYTAVKDLETLKGRIASSADNLQRALQSYDRVQMLLARHYAYLYLRYAVNTKDETSLADSSVLDADVMSRTAFLRQELMQLDDKILPAFVAQKPSLKKYRFYIEDVRRYRPHTLSLKEEELLSATSPITSEWQADLYGKLIARTRLGTVRVPGGNPGNPDRAAREEAFKKHYAGFVSQRDLYAFALIRLVTARNQLARLRHFEDATSEIYFSRYGSKAEVNKLLEQIAQHADLYKRYQRIRTDHVKQITGYDEINLWDLSIRPQGVQLPRFTINQASQVIREALAPLGNDYGQELAKLLDPANGRMDIVPGENRKSGGFSKGYIGTDSVFYSAGFAGYYNDVRVLAHESTHAVHRQLMNSNQVLPPYASGPSYFFEAFAIFSEFLLPDYLYNHETDPLRKQYFLEQFLEGKGMQMFVVAPEAVLEQAVYDGVAQGGIKGADELDALTKRIYSRYSIWPDKHDELKSQWMMVTLMYEDPIYDINYVYGVLLALKFYELYSQDPKHFMTHYIALMKNGFDAPPAELLKRFLQIDLNDSRLLSDALRVLAGKVELLESLYRKN